MQAITHADIKVPNLERMIELKFKSNVVFSIEADITPTLAKHLLDNMIVNRPIKEDRVDQYLRDFNNGYWGDSNDCLCFTIDGMLGNGGHRMNAVLRYDKPVRFTLKFGMTKDAILNNVDKGIPRSLSDTMVMSEKYGADLAPIISATARMIIGYKKTDIPKALKHSLSTNELIHFIESDTTIKTSSQLIATFPGKNTVLTRTTAAFLHWKLRSVNKDAATEFVTQIMTGAGIEQDSLVQMLIQKLQQCKNGRSRWNPARQLRACAQTWNAIRKKVDISPRSVGAKKVKADAKELLIFPDIV